MKWWLILCCCVVMLVLEVNAMMLPFRSSTWNIIRNPVVSLKLTADRFSNGTKLVVEDVQRGFRLRKQRSQRGIESLTYDEFKLLETLKQDLGKVFSLALYLKFSPRVFLISNVLKPMFSSSPWAWSGYPSQFDQYEPDIERRTEVLQRRKHTALFHGIAHLYSTNDDNNSNYDAESTKAVQSQANMIEKALRCDTLDAAVDVLDPWLRTEIKHSKRLKLDTKQFVAPVIARCCRALDSSPFPNLPLIRRFNIGTLADRIDKIRASDLFLRVKGIEQLSAKELKRACAERCIYHSNRPEQDLRNELNQWLNVAFRVDNVQVRNRNKVYVVNEQNRRLALMGLSVARGVQHSSDFNIIDSLLHVK